MIHGGTDRLAAALAMTAMAATLVACGGGDDAGGSNTLETGPSSPGSATPERPTDMPSGTPAKKLSAAAQARVDEQLRDAAWNNDVATARRLIGRGADVNAKDETVQSAYLISTSEGYLDLLRLTLRRGARVDDKDSWNGTGLIRAAERGHYGVVGELLGAGIDRDHVNRIGYQAIHEAVWLGEDDEAYATTLRVLAAGGVELDRPSRSEGLTPLQMARSKGYGGLERVLTRVTSADRPADPDSALLRAAATGDADAAAVALRSGADIEAQDSGARTPLQLAAAQDHVDVARLLVAMGADRA